LATHPVLQGVEALKKQYPQYVFSKKPMAEEDDKPSAVLPQFEYVPIVLNRETLTEAVFMEVTTQHTLEMDEEFRLHHLLEAIHD